MGNNYQGSDYLKTTFFPILLFNLFLVGVIVACALPTVTIQWSSTETPTPTSTASPTQTSTPVPTDTSIATPIPATKTPPPTATRILSLAGTATPQFAPFCEDAARQSQCQYPLAGQSSSFCSDKSPYNLIFLNDDATYRVLQEYVQCSEAGTIDGQRMITCTGPMAYYFELQVCDSACSSLSIESGDIRCPRGYNYNNLGGCCTKETQEVDQGCTVLKLRTKSCVIDCGQLTTEKTCTNYGYACRWDDENDVCYLRR